MIFLSVCRGLNTIGPIACRIPAITLRITPFVFGFVVGGGLSAQADPPQSPLQINCVNAFLNGNKAPNKHSESWQYSRYLHSITTLVDQLAGHLGVTLSGSDGPPRSLGDLLSEAIEMEGKIFSDWERRTLGPYLPNAKWPLDEFAHLVRMDLIPEPNRWIDELAFWNEWIKLPEFVPSKDRHDRIMEKLEKKRFRNIDPFAGATEKAEISLFERLSYESLLLDAILLELGFRREINGSP